MKNFKVNSSWPEICTLYCFSSDRGHPLRVPVIDDYGFSFIYLFIYFVFCFVSLTE